MRKSIVFIVSLFLFNASAATTDPKVSYELVQQGKAVIVDIREEVEIHTVGT